MRYCMWLSKQGCLSILSGILLCASVQAAEIRVGCVSNFLSTFTEIVRLFEKNSGNKIVLSGNTSRGALYTEIKERNDLDVALMGDESIAQKLENEGFAVKNSRFTYAIGKLALWSKRADLVDIHGDVLIKGNFQQLAIPDPSNNAYGIAAKQTLEKLGVFETLHAKTILSATVGDAYKAVVNDQVELGMTALSLLNPSKKIEGSVWIVPQRFYVPLQQQVVLLKSAENNEAAKEFLQYLKTPQVVNIIEKYGYSLPKL